MFVEEAQQATTRCGRACCLGCCGCGGGRCCRVEHELRRRPTPTLRPWLYERGTRSKKHVKVLRVLERALAEEVREQAFVLHNAAEQHRHLRSAGVPGSDHPPDRLRGNKA